MSFYQNIQRWLRLTLSTSGPSVPLAPSNIIGNSAPLPPTVLPNSATAVLSIEEPKMSLTLSAIATALTAVSSAVKASEVIYTAGAQLIQVAETAYASASSAGATKKAAVLAALEALAKDLGTEWSTISGEVSSWIDMVIQTWNTLKGISATPAATPVAVVEPAAPVADVPVSQQTL